MIVSVFYGTVIYILKPLNKNSLLEKKKLTKCMKHLNTLNYENKRIQL